MNFNSPENCGISSAAIEKYVRTLEENQLFTHNLIIAKGDDIIFEKYWSPFNKDFLHREYSVSKSIVAIAVGFAEQDGLVGLDDPVEKYFPAEAKLAANKLLPKQTVRHMLMMSTTVKEEWWFGKKPADRVKLYFENPNTDRRPDGTAFDYDSSGSFILAAMVERVSGKPFMDYLRDKLFRKIGVSEEARCLKCPGGHSWGDSGCLMTARDLLLISRFMLNGGNWNGEQLLNEEYIKTATSRLIDNNPSCIFDYDTFGYGYLIWRTYDDSWSFQGMGCQFAICVPDKDLILIYNGDNQGNPAAAKLIFDNFFNIIVRPEHDLSDAKSAQISLAKYTENLKLGTAKGEACSVFGEKINGKRFALAPNRMGIKYIKVDINKSSGIFEYENKTGIKKIKFGMTENVFTAFPEEGYSDEVGTEYAKGRYYKCAASAAWVEEKKLFIHLQAIDTYFGKLNITLGWKDDKTLGVYMCKAAEDFFCEYEGFAEGYAE